MLKVDTISYGGWKRCLRLTNREIELIVTLEVGPRIIRCGFIGGQNEFAEYPEQMGRAGDPEYHSYGGHRLWVAPEDKGRTYYPDNHHVEWMVHGEALLLKAQAESHLRIQKEMEIWIDPHLNTVHVIHRIRNCAHESLALSAWAISVMAPGGRAIIPQETFRPHPEVLQPIRSMALWSYSKMGDPRWTWGSRYIQLRQDPGMQDPQKIGLQNSQGWLAYHNGNRLFVKTVPFKPNAAYPDFQCNAEVFTNARMLELETLSPVTSIQPEGFLQHEEHWFLYRDVRIGSSDEEIADGLNGLLTPRTSR